VAVDRQGRDLVSLEHAARRCIVAGSDEALITAMMST